jgi:signal transduction histidine kinase
MRLTLRAKVTLTVSLFLVAIFALAMYLSLTRNVSQLHSSLNEQSKSFASLATPPIGNTFLLYQDSGSIKITQQVNKFLELDPDVAAISIVSVDGKQLYGSQGATGLQVSSSLASSFSAQYVKNNAGYVHEVVQPFFEDSGAHRYSIVYKISTKRVEQSVNDAIRQILYVGIAILIIGIAATGWALNVLFIKPLREVSRSADIISAGNYNQQIVSHADSKDEIGKLAQAVNKMAEYLKADIVKLREVDKLKSEFMMIASHNLRTPLSVMRGNIEMAEYAKSEEELKKIITNVGDGVVRLHLLAEDLLTIATLEAGGEKMRKSPVEVKKFIDATVSEFELLAKQKQLAWQFSNTVPGDLELDLNQANMRSALGNLIDNAIKFTKENGSVNVNCRITDNQLIITVVDTGIGIAADEIPKLFTKFHRGTSPLIYDYEGVGIGLYLTKLIVEEHGGQVAVDSEADRGSTFTVTLPLAPSSEAPLSAEPSAPPAPAVGHHVS